MRRLIASDAGRRALLACVVGGFYAMLCRHPDCMTLLGVSHMNVVAVLWLDGLLCLAIDLFGKFSVSEFTLWSERFVLFEQPLVTAIMLGLLGFLVPFARDGLLDLIQPRTTRLASS